MKDVLFAIYCTPSLDVTLSAIYKKGKITSYRKVHSNDALRAQLLAFSDPKADLNAVADAGKHFLLPIFGANNIESYCKAANSFIVQFGCTSTHFSSCSAAFL